MVTFCKFPLKNFILSVFFYFQPVTICHRFTPPGSTAAPASLNQTPAASTPARQFQPPLFPPLPNGNAKKNYKPTKLSRFRTRIAHGRARSTCAPTQARAGTLERRGAGVLLPSWRVAAGLAGCCRAGGLLPGWRVAAELSGCCWAGVLLPGCPGWRSGPILCSLCKLHSRTP